MVLVLRVIQTGTTTRQVQMVRLRLTEVMSMSLICKEYESNFNIKQAWAVVGIGNQDINTRFGVVCQMPDGRWVEKGYE